MNAAVFLDRDNTIIHNDGDLGDPAQVRMIQGAASAIASLRGLNYKVIVVTNQGGVARGNYGEADVEAVHQRINELVHQTTGCRIERFYYCPYHPQGTVEQYRSEHPWRKPQPGMLLQAAKDLRLDLSRCWMIGDQPRDVEAGKAAGCRTILLTASASELPPLHEERSARAADLPSQPDFTARNVTEAVRIIAKQRRPEISEDLRQDDESLRQPTRDEPARTPRPAQSPAAENDTEKAIRIAQPTPPTPLATEPSRPRKPRPFRPLGLPGPDPGVEPEPEPESEPEPAPEAVHAPPAPRPVAPSPAPDIAQTPAPDTAVEPAVEDAVMQVSASDTVPGEVSKPRRKGPPPTPAADVTLREILQELRNQRTMGGEFSYMMILAIVLQVAAIVCLLAALMLGRDNLTAFSQWMSIALLVQLATVAMLLFDRKG